MDANWICNWLKVSIDFAVGDTRPNLTLLLSVPMKSAKHAALLDAVSNRPC